MNECSHQSTYEVRLDFDWYVIIYTKCVACGTTISQRTEYKK